MFSVSGVLSIRRLLVWKVIALFPSTRGYELKRLLLNFAGHDLARGTKCVSSMRATGVKLITLGPCFIGHEVRFYGAGNSRSSVTIGSDVAIGPGVTFLLGTHEVGSSTKRAGRGVAHNSRVGDGAWLGARSIVVGPADVGAGCIVGAGTTVVRTLPDNTALVASGDRSWDLPL